MTNIIIGLMGATIGLLLGALASAPLSKLPGTPGSLLPLVVSAILTIIMMAIALVRRSALLAIMPFLDPAPRLAPAHAVEPVNHTQGPSSSVLPQILVDTSVIIDGRIADIATAGFVPGRLSVPRFVLAELQNIADSDDAMRRGRGRRGLDVLNTLRELPDVDVTIIEDDVPGIKEVDAKLVALAQRFSCNVLTTDYNLNRVAQIQGVRVLNVNELSNAIRPVVLPGEELLVRVVQPGKERNQGVGYLADGTMIVVENGDKLMGQEVATEVTRVFQTVAGKMIFAAPRPGVLNHNNAVSAPNPPVDHPTSPAPASIPSPGPSATDAQPASSPNPSRRRSNHNRGNANKKHQASPNSADNIEDRIVAAVNKPQNPRSN